MSILIIITMLEDNWPFMFIYIFWGEIKIMRRKTIVTVVAAILVLLAAGIQYYIQSQPVFTGSSVTRIIDGDTRVVEGGDRVRLLDIDTPEKGQPCSANATARLAELIDGKEVLLEKRGEDKDRYDRLLRY